MLFRKKNKNINAEVFDPQKTSEKVTSPERLDVYLQVANPGTIFSIIAIFLLLGGFIIWGIFGTIERSIPVTVTFRNSSKGFSSGIAYVNEEQVDLVNVGMKVRTSDMDGFIVAVSDTPEKHGNAKMYPVYLSLNGDNRTGSDTGTIIIDEIRPLTYIIN